ncbi:MAG TPA: hypothetical protein VL551_33900 [Actinospica sp.]|nr:hypothetical protein [Actinospica sp.]
MYQFFEILPGDGPARMYRPAQPVALEIVVALLGATGVVVTGTDRLDLLLWIDADALVGGREPNPRASAVARAVFRSPAAAVCGPLVITSGTADDPAALEPEAADEAYAYLFALESAGATDGGRL